MVSGILKWEFVNVVPKLVAEWKTNVVWNCVLFVVFEIDVVENGIVNVSSLLVVA